MSDFIPEEDRPDRPEPAKPGAQFVRAVLEHVPWGVRPWLYTDPNGTEDSYSTAAIAQDVIEALYHLGILHDHETGHPLNALAAAKPEEVDIDEVARYLRDLADHPRFEDPPRGLGHEALIGQEGNVLMAARHALARTGTTNQAEIVAARDILVRHARDLARQQEAQGGR